MIKLYKKSLLLITATFLSIEASATVTDINSIINKCAPQTPSHVAHAIIKTESSYNPIAIGINRNGKSVGGFKKPTNYNEAVILAKTLINNGENIDLGLAQINSANLKRLGLSVEQVLKPCVNLSAMQYILSDCYARAGDVGYGQKIQRAFSCYNTGNHRNGFFNGYVNKATSNMNNHLSVKVQYIPLPTNNIDNEKVALGGYSNYNQNGENINVIQDEQKVQDNIKETESTTQDVFSKRHKQGFF